MFGVPLECGGAELGGPDFEGDSEGVRRCLTMGRNKVPPFSTRKKRQWISGMSGEMCSRTRDDMMMETEKVIETVADP